MFQFKGFARQPSKREAARTLSQIEKGIYFGYPSCCVEEFAIYGLQFFGCLPDLVIRTQPRILHMSGFVPCVECNLRKTRRELEEHIETYRQCPTEFPKHELVTDDLVFKGLSVSNHLLKAFAQRRPMARAWLEPLIAAYLQQPVE